jgi:hypothetical protein
MQAELEKWKKDHVIYSADQKAAVILLEDLEAMLAGKVLCEKEPVAYIEHHKGGDNLNCDRVDHEYAKATPLYAAASLTGNADIGKEGGK